MIVDFIYPPSLFIAIFITSLQRFVSSQQTLQQNSAQHEFTYTLDEGYPIGDKLFGNIAGVDVDKENNVIIFHRGSHIWETNTFDQSNVYQLSKDSPIPEETVITINPSNKKIIKAWGRNTFFLPHGLSLDPEATSLWLTDVAMHQVFKYSIEGTELLTLGTAFVPGDDDSHFCKPTSVADTGDYVFVADGYCNSRVAMFSSSGKFLGQFGQSTEAALYSPNNNQPIFNIPHKIVYSKEANMICVAVRESGRIQCFSFEPKHKTDPSAALSSSLIDDDKGLLLNGAIQKKFLIADPLFNGRVFSIDYCPIRGGIIVAVSGESLYTFPHRPALGFVYNVTTGQLISRFFPPADQAFGMAHDLAITGDEAESLYVVDISPVHLWRFSRPIQRKIELHQFKTADLSKIANQAISIMRSEEHGYGVLWYLIVFTIVALLVYALKKSRRISPRISSNSGNTFASLYSNGYPASINSLFGNSNRLYRRGPNGATVSNRTTFSTMFSRRAFFNLFDRTNNQQNDFSRIPLEDSDNSDDDKTDSDVEEFNINQASNPSVKINV